MPCITLAISPNQQNMKYFKSCSGSRTKFYLTQMCPCALHLITWHLILIPRLKSESQFPGHEFLFLHFLLGHLCLLCNLLCWLRNPLLLFSKAHLTVAGKTHIRVALTTRSVSPALHLGGFIHLDVLNYQRICIEALKFSIPPHF